MWEYGFSLYTMFLIMLFMLWCKEILCAYFIGHVSLCHCLHQYSWITHAVYLHLTVLTCLHYFDVTPIKFTILTAFQWNPHKNLNVIYSIITEHDNKGVMVLEVSIVNMITLECLDAASSFWHAYWPLWWIAKLDDEGDVTYISSIHCPTAIIVHFTTLWE